MDKGQETRDAKVKLIIFLAGKLTETIVKHPAEFDEWWLKSERDQFETADVLLSAATIGAGMFLGEQIKTPEMRAAYREKLFKLFMELAVRGDEYLTEFSDIKNVLAFQIASQLM